MAPGIIYQQKFDVLCNDRDLTKNLHEKITTIFYQQLISEISRIVDFYIPGNVIFRINKLEIDLGVIVFDKIEHLLPERFADELEKVIAGYVYNFKKNASFNDNNFLQADFLLRDIDIISFFLMTGTYPWWSKKLYHDDMLQLFSDVLTKEQANLKKLLAELGHFEYVRKRLSLQFPATLIVRVIEILEPQEASFIVHFHHDITGLNREKNIVHGESSAFEKDIWYFILTYLLTQSGPSFNQKQFIKSNLTQIASNYNISYLQLLNILGTALLTVLPVKDKATSRLAFHIKALQSDELNTVVSGSVMPGGKSYSFEEKLQLLSYYFITGSLPLWASHINEKQMALLLGGIATENATLVSACLIQLANNTAAFNRLSVLIKSNTNFQEELTQLVQELQGKLSASTTNNNQVFNNGVGGEIIDDGISYLPPEIRIERKEYLFNYVIFLLVTGHLPWWAAGENKTNLLRELIDHYPEEAIAILKYSGNDIDKRTRFTRLFSKINIVFFLDSVSNALGNNNILRFTLRQWGEDETVQLLAHDVYEGIVIDTFWDSLIETAYSSFNTAVFFKDVIQKIAALLQIDVLQVVLSLLKTTGKSSPLNGSTNSMRYWLKDVEAYCIAQKKLVAYNPYFFMQFVRLKLVESGQGAAPMFLHTAIKHFVINFFKNGALPYPLDNISLYEQQHLFKAALYHLYLTEKLFVQQVVSNYKAETVYVSAAAQILLSQGDWPAELAQLINLQPAKDIATETHDSVEALAAPAAMFLLEIDLAHLAGNYTIYYPALKNIDTQLLIVKLLDYFMKWNELPPTYVHLKPAEKDKLLATALLALYKTNPGIIETLIQNQGYSINSKVSLISIIRKTGNKYVSEELGSKIINEARLTNEMAGIKYYDEEENDASRKVITGISQYFAGINDENSDKTGEAFYDVDFFITHGHLPNYIKLESDSYENIFIKALVFYLHKHKKERLDSVLLNTKASPENKLHFYALFVQNSNTEEALFLAYLQPFIEDDIVTFLVSPPFKKAGFANSTLEKIIALLSVEVDAAGVEKLQKLLQYKIVPVFFEQHNYTASVLAIINKIVITGKTDKQADFAESTPLELYFQKLEDHFGPTSPFIRIIHIFRAAHVPAINYPGDEERIKKLRPFLSQHISLFTDDVYQALAAFIAINTTIEGIPDHALQLLHNSFKTIADTHVLAAKAVNVPGGKHPVFAEFPLLQSSLSSTGSGIDKTDAQIKLDKEIQQIEDRIKEDKMQRVVVSNAGLVLFSSFFPTLFSKLQLTVNNAFTNIDAQYKAIYVLQYLVCGDRRYEEHELVLNKLICGFDLYKPLPGDIFLTDDDKLVVSGMLNFFLSQWEQMQNTSIEGFRASFLARDGYVYAGDNGWVLKIENRPYDVLLQTFPWPYSTVKYTWMKDIIFVEWLY